MLAFYFAVSQLSSGSQLDCLKDCSFGEQYFFLNISAYRTHDRGRDADALTFPPNPFGEMFAPLALLGYRILKSWGIRS